MTHISEDDIENATLTWFAELGRERNTYSDVVLKDRPPRHPPTETYIGEDKNIRCLYSRGDEK